MKSRLEADQREARLRETLIDDPNNAVAWTDLAQVLREQRKFHAADSAFRRATAAAPTDPQARLAYANFLEGVGDKTTALKQVDQALKRDRKLTEAHALKGRLLRDTGRNSEAIREFEVAWKANPPSSLAGVELARWDLQRGMQSSAADKLALCVAREPENSVTRKLYAQTLANLGRNPDAIREWETLAARGEAGPEGTYRLAELYAKQGMQDQAWNTYAEARRLAPKHPLYRSVGMAVAGRTQSPTDIQAYPELVSSRR